MHMACDVEVALYQLLSFKIVTPMPIYSNSDGTPLQIHFWGGQSIVLKILSDNSKAPIPCSIFMYLKYHFV